MDAHQNSPDRVLSEHHRTGDKGQHSAAPCLWRQTDERYTDFKETRMDLCLANKLLIVTPWLYSYRRVGDTISVAECKAMNCVVQSICRTKDSWWKEEL